MLDKQELCERAVEILEEFYGVDTLTDEQREGCLVVCDEVWSYVTNEIDDTRENADVETLDVEEEEI